MEFIGIIIFLVIAYVLSHLGEWLACSRTTPPGYETDWTKMNEDIRKHGKQYTFNQINKGKYDIKKK